MTPFGLRLHSLAGSSQLTCTQSSCVYTLRAFALCAYPYMQDGKEVDRLEGADAPGLTNKVTKLAATAGAAATTAAKPASAAAPSAAAAASGGPVDVVSRIKTLLADNKVCVVFVCLATRPATGACT